MRWWSGNKTRIIKKQSPGFDFGGCHYNWTRGIRLLNIVSRLQVGHIIWVPWMGQVNDPKNWGVVEKIEFEFGELWKVHGRKCYGFTIHVRGSNNQLYCLYDIEHWFFRWTGAETIQFNRQLGLADDFHFRQDRLNELSLI